MAQPTQNSVHVNRPLTMISVAYMQGQDSFIADKVFPVIPVDKQSDLYFIYTKNDWFRDEAQPRAAGTESAGSGYGLSTDSYKCDVFALHKDIPDQVRANEDAPLNSDRDATEFVTNRLLLRREIQWATDYFATSVWGTDSTPSNLWSDYTSSDPIGDIRTGKRTVKLNTGFDPNTLVLGYDVFLKLQDHPDIIDRYKYTTSSVITEAMLAPLFGVAKVLVAGGVKATNVEGETAAYSFIQGKHALLAYVAPRPSVLTPSAGYIFGWKGVSQGNGFTVGTKKFRMEHLESDRVEGQVAFDNKVVATDLGYFFASVVS
jgi:hypothetical protein